MKKFLEKNEKPKKSEKEEKKRAEVEKKKLANNEKSEANINDKINNSDKIINYFIENQNQEALNMPDFKVKSKHMRLFRKCLKLKKNNLNKVFDKTGILLMHCFYSAYFNSFFKILKST